MAEPRGIPFSVGEARALVETDQHLDIYVREIIAWLCNQVDAHAEEREAWREFIVATKVLIMRLKAEGCSDGMAVTRDHLEAMMAKVDK